jgi:hypothetical protein
MLGPGTTLAFQPLASMQAASSSVILTRASCFGIKDGIKQASRNRKILVWQRIIAGFDPSRPSQLILLN